MCWLNDAGVETCLPTGGGSLVTGSGVVNRLAYWTSATNLDDVPRTFTAGSVLFAHSDFLPQEDNANFFWDDSNNLLVIGTAGVIHGSAATTRLALDRDSQDTVLELSTHGDGKQGIIQFNASRGTHASKTIVASGDDAGLFQVRAYDGANYQSLAFIRFFVDGTPGASDMPGRMSFWTTPDGSATPAERFRIASAGQWGIGGATFGGSGDIFSSGGASAPPTWVTRATLNAALDHGLLTGNADDDHTQYALLAGRSGGQVLIGGTAAADDLTLQATSGAGAGSETITGLVGNNGSITGFVLTQANSQAVMRINGATNNAPFSVRNTSDSANAMDLLGDSANANVQFRRYSADVSGAVFLALKGRGTVGSPGQALSGDFPVVFESRAVNASGGTETGLATFRSVLSENTTTTGHGSRWDFLVVPNGSTTQALSVKFPEDGGIAIQDGITAPATLAGYGKIYIDTADGDLKIKFGDGTVKTIVTDT